MNDGSAILDVIDGSAILDVNDGSATTHIPALCWLFDIFQQASYNSSISLLG